MPKPINLLPETWTQPNQDAQNTAGIDSHNNQIRELRVEWSASTSLANAGNIICDGKRTYLVERVDEGDRLVARSVKTGEKQWIARTELLPETIENRVGQLAIGTPVATEELLFVPVSVVPQAYASATAAGLAALNPANGEVVWSTETWAINDLRAGETGRLYLIEQSTEGLRERSKSTNNVRQRLRAFDAHEGTACWTYDEVNDGILDSITGSSTFDSSTMIKLPAVDSDFYYLPIEYKDESRTHVNLVKKSSGNLHDSYTIPNPVQVGATVANGILYTAMSDAPTVAEFSGPAIVAFDARTGKFRWATPLSNEIATFSVTRDALCYSDDEAAVVAALNPKTGESRWQSRSPLATTPPILGNYVVTQAPNGEKVRVQTLDGGAVTSSVELTSISGTIDSVAATHSHLFVADSNVNTRRSGVLYAVRIR